MNIVFILGAARSGTTMMSRILGNHPRICSFRELHFFEELWTTERPIKELSEGRALKLASSLYTMEREGYFAKRQLDVYEEDSVSLIHSIATPLTPPAVFEAFLQRELHLRGRQMACLHTPRDLHYLRDILELFPGARVLFMIRDPRAVLASQKRRWRRYYLSPQALPRSFILRAWMNYHPITYSLIWRRAAAVAEAYAGHPCVRCVRFEDLVDRPTEQIEQICGFLGLKPVGDMTRVPLAGSSHGPDQSSRLGLDAEVAHPWRRNALDSAEVWLCQRIAGEAMIHLGYDLQAANSNVLRLAYYAFTWLPKLTLAFLLNLRRTRSPLTALRRRVGRIVG
jgi:hypothetical protein